METVVVRVAHIEPRALEAFAAMRERVEQLLAPDALAQLDEAEAALERRVLGCE